MAKFIGNGPKYNRFGNAIVRNMVLLLHIEYKKNQE